MRATEFRGTGIILDVGCGTGELLSEFTREVSGPEYVGIDLGEHIYEAKREYDSNAQRLHFVRADCRYLPVRSACSQIAFCASVLEHLPDVEAAISEIARTLGPEGKLVVGVPTENLLYRIGRRLGGFRKPIDHYHDATSIEMLLSTTLDSEFIRSRVLKLPIAFLPPSGSLYRIMTYERKPTYQAPQQGIRN